MIATIQTAQILTGELAAKALAENEPELCEQIREENEEELCFPPENRYVLRQEEIATTFIADEGIQTQIHIQDDTILDIQAFVDSREELYQDTLFMIQMIEEGLLSIQSYDPAQAS